MNYYKSSYTVEDDERVGELLEILTTQHCRPLFQYFREASEEVASVPELADELLDEEEDSEQVKIQLQHSTLPRLEDVGVIEYEPRSNTVRYHGDPELEALLNAIREFSFEERNGVSSNSRPP